MPTVTRDEQPLCAGSEPSPLKLPVVGIEQHFSLNFALIVIITYQRFSVQALVTRCHDSLRSP